VHIVHLPHIIDIGRNGGLLPAGRYIMEDRNLAQMILWHPDDGIGANKMADYTPYVAAADHVLVAGGIGLGDAIMLTPVLRCLHELGKKVRVACFNHYRQPLINLPYIDGFEEWPLLWETGSFATHNPIFLEGFLNHPMARTHHMTDVFAAICQVDLTDKRADYLVMDAERDWAEQTFPRVKGRKRLGLQVQASHRCRSYAFDRMRDLCQLMIKGGWEVYLMGAIGEYQHEQGSHFHDARVKAPEFREMSAFLNTCDAFVGPDSGFLHVAGALGVPAVGLFGAFPWQLRTAYYPSVYGINGEGECAPCFHSPTTLQPAFPVGKPCSKTGRCEVLATISPERIKEKLVQIAR